MLRGSLFFSRNDSSLISRWWFGIDRIAFLLIMLLILCGIVLNFAATPAIAHRLGHDAFYFVKRHIIYIAVGVCILCFVSSLNTIQLRKMAFVLLACLLLFLIVTPLIGTEIKGARRWIIIKGFSFQPSEFIKPCFMVVSGWLLSKHFNPYGIGVSFGLLCGIVLFLLLQPDLGMVCVFVASWFCQLYIAGIAYKWVLSLMSLAPFGLLGAYFIFPHVSRRINLFLHKSDTGIENYQITRSLEAFMKGGLFGQGPGEGTIKSFVPDAHSDFIFAVAGEEFGLFFCLLLIALFMGIFYRFISRSYNAPNNFIAIASTGLVVQFVLHSFVNMASTLNMMPTKGMTLPFISYGGSSVMAISLTCGMLLSLTKKQQHID